MDHTLSQLSPSATLSQLADAPGSTQFFDAVENRAQEFLDAVTNQSFLDKLMCELLKSALLYPIFL